MQLEHPCIHLHTSWRQWCTFFHYSVLNFWCNNWNMVSCTNAYCHLPPWNSRNTEIVHCYGVKRFLLKTSHGYNNYISLRYFLLLPFYVRRNLSTEFQIFFCLYIYIYILANYAILYWKLIFVSTQRRNEYALLFWGFNTNAGIKHYFMGHFTSSSPSSNIR